VMIPNRPVRGSSSWFFLWMYVITDRTSDLSFSRIVPWECAKCGQPDSMDLTAFARLSWSSVDESGPNDISTNEGLQRRTFARVVDIGRPLTQSGSNIRFALRCAVQGTLNANLNRPSIRVLLAFQFGDQFEYGHGLCVVCNDSCS
jgi:hypothetical protein